MRQHLHDQVSFTAFTSLLEDLQQQSALLLATLPLHELLAEQLELLATEQQFQRLYYGQGYSLQSEPNAPEQLTRSLLNLVQDQGRTIALPSIALMHGTNSVVEYLRRALLQRIITEEPATQTPQFTQDLARELLETWSDVSGEGSSAKFEEFIRRHYFALDNQEMLYSEDRNSEIPESNKAFKESDNPHELRPLYQQLLHLLHSVAGAHRPANGQLPLSLVRRWYDYLGSGLTGYYFAQEMPSEKAQTQAQTQAQAQDTETPAPITSTKRRRGKGADALSAASLEQASSNPSTTPPHSQGVNFTQLDWEQLVAQPLAARNYLPREWRNLLTPDAILSYIPADLPPLTHMVYRGMVSYYLRPRQRSELGTPQLRKVQQAEPELTPKRRTRKTAQPAFVPRSTAQMRARQAQQAAQGVDRGQLQRLSTQLNNFLRKS